MITYSDSQKEAQNFAPVNSTIKNDSFKSNDNRPEAIQQKKIMSNISESPLMAAQLKTIQKVMNGIAQKQDKLEDEEHTAALRKVKNSENTLQAKFGTASEGNEAIQKKDNNTGLPDNLKSGVENLSGMSLDHVKVHYNSDKPAQLNALAYAQGSDIHVASGQEQHLPHETWHVVQQMQGRVEPTTEVGGVAVNDSVTLESEADVMGAKALQQAL